jgi:REP element-mobilizing transposase RayT
MTGIVQNYNHKLLAINGVKDHVHLLVGMRPTQSMADLMKHVKGDSSEWINKKRFVKGQFEWQDGYGAFSYSKDRVPYVINYIWNQEQHHQKISFLDEYKALLREFEIDFDEKYLFKEPW